MDPFDRYLQENIKISSTTTKTQNTSNSENVTVIDDDLIYFKYNSDEYYCTKQEVLLSVITLILIIVITILLLINRKMKKNKCNIIDKKNNTNIRELNCEQYASLILQILIIDENTFFNKDTPFTCNLSSLSLYYIYHIYICMKILEKKYGKYISEFISDIAFTMTINHLLEITNKNVNVAELKNNNSKYFFNLKSSNIDIFSTNKKRINSFIPKIFERLKSFKLKYYLK